PGRTGVMPGLVEHLFKLHGSYNWDNGFQVGGAYRWNSGVILNRNQGTAFGRSLPDQVDTAFEANGVQEFYIEPDAIGFIDGSDYGVLDLRVSYLWGINDRLEADVFLDVFNALDDQQVIKVEDRLNGTDGFEFLEGTDFVQPRRYFLGARLRF
ncbi:MAG: TonB-dependent receptor, partial [Acidobacteriota bacterium]